MRHRILRRRREERRREEICKIRDRKERDIFTHNNAKVH